MMVDKQHTLARCVPGPSNGGCRTDQMARFPDWNYKTRLPCLSISEVSCPGLTGSIRDLSIACDPEVKWGALTAFNHLGPSECCPADAPTCNGWLLLWPKRRNSDG